MYRRTLFVSVLLAGSAIITGSAAAADIDVAPPLFDWSGFYVGAHVGVLWGGDRDGDCDAFKDIKGKEKDHGGMVKVLSMVVEPPTEEDRGCFDAKIDDGDSPSDGETVKVFDLDGDLVAITDEGDDDDDLRFLVGPQIGINQQYGMWVVGLEADFSFLGGDGDEQDLEFEVFRDEDPGEPIEVDQFRGAGQVEGGELDWIATFRGRLGAAVGSEGRALLYATGGLALAGVEGLSGSFDETGGVGCDVCRFDDDTDDDIRVGYAIGGGGEWAWTETVSIGAEYLFLDFGGDDGESLTFNGHNGRQFSFENELDELHVFRVKLNYRFPPG